MMPAIMLQAYVSLQHKAVDLRCLLGFWTDGLQVNCLLLVDDVIRVDTGCVTSVSNNA